jgi:Ca2+-binding EF-hand superfamily protein
MCSLGRAEGEKRMDEYSAYVREFRQLVLDKFQRQHGNQSTNQMKASLKNIFREIDQNNDGVITNPELRQFILALEIELTPKNNQNISFSEILIHQIDIDNDGKISYHELMEFLWPKEISKREIGAVINKIRLALMSSIKWKYKKLKDLDDVTLIEAFAKLTGAPLLRGNLVEVRSLRKAFSKIHNPTLGNMTKYEVDILVTSLDTNCDGVVSSREFRKWLLRVEDEIDFPPSMMEEIEALQNLTEKEYKPSVEPLETVPSVETVDHLETEPPEEEPADVAPVVATQPLVELAETEPHVEESADTAPVVGTQPPIELESPGEEPVEARPPTTIQDSLPRTQDVPFDPPKMEEANNLRTPDGTTSPVPIVHKRPEPTFIPTVAKMNTSPTTSQAALNQRKNKAAQDQKDHKVKVSKIPTTLPPPTEAPIEQRGSSCLRWMAFFGIGVLVIYAVYRGDLWLPKPYKSLIK